MSLQKVLVHLNMRGGMDSKADERLTLPSKLQALRDAVFDDGSTIIRRGGLTSQGLTALTPGGSGISSPRRLFTNQGNLVIEDNYTGPLAAVKDVGLKDLSVTGLQTFRRAGMTTRPVSGNILRFPNGSYTVPLTGGDYDVAFDATKTRSVWVWNKYSESTTSSGQLSLCIAVVDEATQNVIYTTEYAAASTVYQSPRVVYSAGAAKFLVYYAKYTSGGTQFAIHVRTITATSAVTIGSEGTVWTSPAYGGVKYIGSASYLPIFDVVPDRNTNTNVFFGVAWESAAPNDRLDLKTLTASDGYTVVAAGTITPTARVYQLALDTSTAGDYYSVYGRGATGYIRGIRSTTGFTVNTEADIANRGSVGTEFGRITVGYDSNASELRIAYDNFSTRSASSAVKFSSADRTLGTYTDSVASVPWVIAGRLALESTIGRWYLPTHNNSSTQPTLYLLDVDDTLWTPTATGSPAVIARVEYGECGYVANDWCQTQRVPSVFGYSSAVTFGFPKWVPDAQLVNGEYVQPSQLNRADVDMTDALGQAEVNGLTYLAGGCPHIYDGTNIVEEGFHHAPEILTLTAVAAAGGNVAQGLAAGTFYFCCTLAWQDARGNWHESAPSNVVSVTTTAPLPDVLAAYVVPATWKTDYRVLWYRTIASASLGPFYRTLTASGATVTSDATLAACEQLYTTPGVEGQPLYHDPMPACRHLENHQDRLFLSGCGDGTRLFYSNKAQMGRAIEFSTLLFKRTDYEFGRIVNSQSQDGKLFVLGERKLGVLLGQGPTDTGEQDGYSDIEVIVHDTGAKWTAPRAIATTNEGVWFQSNSGIRLLGRNGAIARDEAGRYKGSEVDRELGTTRNCNAVVGSSKQQIRFYHSGGEVLVYDTLFDQWSRFSNHTHVDAAYAEGRFYHVTSTKLLYYNESAHTDDGTAITMYLVTPQLQFAGIQGFQRVYRAMFAGGPVDTSTDTQVVTLYAGYNFDQNVSTLINAQDITTSVGYFTQFEHHFATQKCEALQLVLYIKSKTDASRFRLTDITLQVGVKTGRFKLPAARRL